MWTTKCIFSGPIICINDLTWNIKQRPTKKSITDICRGHNEPSIMWTGAHNNTNKYLFTTSVCSYNDEINREKNVHIYVCQSQRMISYFSSTSLAHGGWTLLVLTPGSHLN